MSSIEFRYQFVQDRADAVSNSGVTVIGKRSATANPMNGQSGITTSKRPNPSRKSPDSYYR